MRRYREILLDIVAPRHCVFCGVLARADEQNLCRGCRTDLPRCRPARLPHGGDDDVQFALLDYEFPVDAAIKRYKFKRQLHYGAAFAEILCEAEALLPTDLDALQPVPLHWWRRAVRGFNQAEEMAAPLAARLRVPITHDVIRCRRTAPQSGLSAEQRHRNLHDAFRVRRPLNWQHVLLLDDVVTTGATLVAIAAVLHRAGVRRVTSLCLARAAQPTGVKV